VNYGCTGVLLRSAGVLWDLRKNTPYEVYQHVPFNSPVGTSGDCYDRYLLRVEEMRQSLLIIDTCTRLIPEGPTKESTYKFSAPSTKLIKNSMEDLIHHFKYYVQGYYVPSGESYVGVEAPKGEFGVYMVSDGSKSPYRCKLRSPGFLHLQLIDYLSKNLLIADIVTIIGTLDIVFGE
jgi:NADH:ubiquinone oxidoreductase subunit D